MHGTAIGFLTIDQGKGRFHLLAGIGQAELYRAVGRECGPTGKFEEIEDLGGLELLFAGEGHRPATTQAADKQQHSRRAQPSRGKTRGSPGVGHGDTNPSAVDDHPLLLWHRGSDGATSCHIIELL